MGEKPLLGPQAAYVPCTRCKREGWVDVTHWRSHSDTPDAQYHCEACGHTWWNDEAAAAGAHTTEESPDG